MGHYNHGILVDAKLTVSKICPLMSMLRLILLHNRLPWEQYDLLKTPLIKIYTEGSELPVFETLKWL